MEKLKTTAKTLDRVVHVLGVALSVAAVICLVGLLIIGAGFTFFSAFRADNCAV